MICKYFLSLPVYFSISPISGLSAYIYITLLPGISSLSPGFREISGIFASASSPVALPITRYLVPPRFTMPADILSGSDTLISSSDAESLMTASICFADSAVSETRENIRMTARDATGDGAPASLSACIVTRSALTSHSRVSPSARDVRYSASFLAAEVSL